MTASAARRAREEHRRASGEFGEQTHTAPETSLHGVLDLRSRTPLDIDTKLAELYQEQARIATPLRWMVTDAERKRVAVEKAEQDGERYEGQLEHLTLLAEQAEEKVAEVREAADTKVLEALPYEREYRDRGGWPRAFLAESAGGHVHRSTHCSTCNNGNARTRFAWLTDYSGMADEEIIAAAGADCCTVCWPEAPTESLSRPRTMFSPAEKRTQQEREERAAAKLAREAKKLANALTPDGSEFVVQTEPGETLTWLNTERFKTERAAVLWATDQTAWRIAYRDAEKQSVADAAIRSIAKAVAAKHGRPVEYVLGEFRIKGDVKAKRITAAEGKKALAVLAAEHGVTP